MRHLILILAAGGALFAQSPRLSFTKSFPGRSPAFLEITVERSGDAMYKEDPKDENPLKFKLSEADLATMFALADKLDHFSRPLESGLKVAFMGAKTFRYEGPGGAKETKFNYSE